LELVRIQAAIGNSSFIFLGQLPANLISLTPRNSIADCCENPSQSYSRLLLIETERASDFVPDCITTDSTVWSIEALIKLRM
jgi:hypothetical protein